MTLRAIDITGQAPVPSIDPGPLPRVIMVNLDELVVDETYQRPLGRANWMMIRRIAERFQWSRFQPIMVAQVPDGRYAVIDGQHRAHAAALAGHVAVPAALVAIPRSDQASAFSEINTARTGISQFHLLKAGLAAGETWALECQRAVEQGGARLMTFNISAATRKPRQIFSLGLVREFVKAGRGALVTTALSAITGSTQAENVDFYREAVLRALFVVLRDHPDFLYLDLARVVDLINLDDWSRSSEHLRGLPDMRGASILRCRAEALRRYLSDKAWPGIKPKRVTASFQTRSVAILPELVSATCATDDPAPRNPSWPEDRDAAVIASGGKYAKITELAEKWDIPIATVQARWHRLRAA